MKTTGPFLVRIYDGSRDIDSPKAKVTPLRVYFDTAISNTIEDSAGLPVSGESWRILMEEHLQSKTAVSFFCISGGQDDQGKFSFRSTKNTFIAKALGTKAEMLNSDEVLHNLPVADTVAFELQTTNASRDWSIETGKETRCGLLSTFSRTATDVPELDNGETIWQCNWARVTEPPEGQTIRSSDGARLWLAPSYAPRRHRIHRALHHRASSCQTRQCRRRSGV